MSSQVCRNMAVSMLLLSLSLGLAFLQRLVSAPTIRCRAMILLLHDMAHELQGRCIYGIAAVHVSHALITPLILQKAQSSVQLQLCLPCWPDARNDL